MANDHLAPIMAAIIEDGTTRMLLEGRMRAILAAYERATHDEEAKLPTYLVAALEAAKDE